MKRIIGVLLILSIIVFPLISIADLEVPDYSSLSLDELLQINQALQSVIFEKAAQYEGIRIFPGYYEVGIDIPAGKYRVVFPEQEGLVIVHVYQDAKKAETRSLIRDTYMLEPVGGKEIIGCLNLKEGNVVEFTNGNLIFSSYLGLF